jgi:hypothetical protein
MLVSSCQSSWPRVGFDGCLGAHRLSECILRRRRGASRTIVVNGRIGAEVRPRLPLFEGDPTLAERVDELLEGFGQG